MWAGREKSLNGHLTVFVVKRANSQMLAQKPFPSLWTSEPCIGASQRIGSGASRGDDILQQPQNDQKCPQPLQVWSPPKWMAQSGFVDTYACVSTGQLRSLGAASADTWRKLLTDGWVLSEWATQGDAVSLMPTGNPYLLPPAHPLNLTHRASARTLISLLQR